MLTRYQLDVNICLLINSQQKEVNGMSKVDGYNQKKLEAAIKEKGVSRISIAEYLKISPTSLSYKINGIREFKGSEIFKICEFLGIAEKEPIFFSNYVDYKSP